METPAAFPRQAQSTRVSGPGLVPADHNRRQPHDELAAPLESFAASLDPDGVIPVQLGPGEGIGRLQEVGPDGGQDRERRDGRQYSLRPAWCYGRIVKIL